MRLNAGCGPIAVDGWTNVDAHDWGQEHIADLQKLPFDDGQFDVTSCNHVLQAISYLDLVPALTELRRVTYGWVRFLVPDLEAATFAYHRGDAAHFQVSDDLETSIAGKYSLYVSQAGATRSVFTFDWLSELCHRAGFGVIHKARFHETISGHPEITELDSRADESIILEARR